MMKLCPHCRWSNEQDWRFCQRCNFPLNAPAVSSSRRVPQPAVIALGVLALAFIGLVTTAAILGYRQEQARVAQARREVDEQEATTRTALERGDLAGAITSLDAVLALHARHAGRLRGYSAEETRQLKAQCEQALDEDYARRAVEEMTDEEAARFVRHGELPAAAFFPDTRVDSIFRTTLLTLRADAGQIRTDSAKKKAEDKKAFEEARKREEQARVKNETEQASDSDPLVLKRATWYAGGFGAVGIWQITIHNRSTRAVGNIRYRTTYYSETKNVVGTNTDVIQKRIEPGKTRTIEVNDSFINKEAHTANFEMLTWDFLE